MRDDEGRLKHYGFEEAGYWQLSDTHKSHIRHQLTALRDRRVLYAFVRDTEVVYVGICDGQSRTLKKRMNNYQSFSSKVREGTTNRNVRGHIKAWLEGGSKVRIFGLEPTTAGGSDYVHQGLAVDLVKGLENPLIEVFDPILNSQAPSRRAKRKETRSQKKKDADMDKKRFSLAFKEDYDGLLASGLSKEEADELIRHARAAQPKRQPPPTSGQPDD